jgi:2-polyprenyl-3-methyl-5-hydroxy-6-metoxy-1,4-benzoquinol methylase
MTPSTCASCGNTTAETYSRPKDYVTGETFSVVRCLRCGLVYVKPQPPVGELARYYPTRHQESKPAAYERMDAKARIKFVSPLVRQGGRVLDVGCGKGLLLAGLRQRGCEVFGTELSEVSARYAQSLGLSVSCLPVEYAPFEPGTFDLVTVFHVLEHLTQPRDTLAVLHTLLRPGGILVVEVPNIGSWYARLFGDDWFHYDVPRHLYHFNQDTLRNLLASTGFRVIETQTRNLQYDAFGAVQSLLNRVLRQPNVLNNFNTGQTTFNDLWSAKRKIANLSVLGVSELVLALGFPLAVLIGVATAPWVNGGTLRYVAEKPMRTNARASPASIG